MVCAVVKKALVTVFNVAELSRGKGTPAGYNVLLGAVKPITPVEVEKYRLLDASTPLIR
jgi:hypothetical protein